MGVFFYSRRLYDRALVAFEQALRLLPESAALHYNLGGTLFGMGRFAGAETAFRTALGLDPDHLEARYFLGLTLRELGRSTEALHEMETVFRSGPSDRLRREAREQIAILRAALEPILPGRGES